MTDQITTLADYQIGDTTARYVTNAEGRVGLWLFPTSTAEQLVERRPTLANESWVRDSATARAAMTVESLVQVKITGDDEAPQHGPGRSLMWATSIDRFHLSDQREGPEGILTTLTDDTGLRIVHRLAAGPFDQTLISATTFFNDSDRPVRLELLTSFGLSGITPYTFDDAPNRLVVHRFRSVWSAEGRLITESIEDLHLERSWAGGQRFSERFGQLGSMPVSGWFPTAVIEDTVAGVSWGARLAIPTSWQLEVGRFGDDLLFAGGLADREFGHWTKTISPGEAFTTPTAWLTCVAGSVDDACDRLVSVDIPAADTQPLVEQDLPIIYNDWCTSWGEPQEEQLLAIADKLAPLGVRYLVIDAGWYMPVGSNAHWASWLGDWQADPTRFPNGLAATAAAIRERGLIPGLWMEPEHVSKETTSFHESEHQHHRDGTPLTMGVRRGWNLHDPWVTQYIDDRVIGLMEDAGFGYLKIDYSETLGLGVDHPDGLGEGIRVHGQGTHAMFERITAKLPDLVIEICSAGGHRMEASMLQRSSMSSFSDAHEVMEIPIIAAAVHRLVLPRQSQIWAVLHHDDSPERMAYSLAATFLGRMCLSGDILDLDEIQLAQVESSIRLYEKAVPVIKTGTTRISGTVGASWRHPTGWQAAVRTNAEQCLVVIHSFAGSADTFTVELPGAGWSIANLLTPLPVTLVGNTLTVSDSTDFASQVVLLERR